MHRLRLTNEFPGETIYRSNLIKVNLDKKKQLLEVAYKENHDLMVSTKKLHDCYMDIFKASDQFHSQRSVSSEYIAQHSEIRQLVQGITPVEFQIPNDAIETLAKILRKCQAYNTKLTEDLDHINYLISEHDIGFNISQCSEGQESGDEEKEIIIKFSDFGLSDNDESFQAHSVLENCYYDYSLFFSKLIEFTSLVYVILFYWFLIRQMYLFYEPFIFHYWSSFKNLFHVK